MWNFILQNTPLLYLSQNVWRDEAYSILIAQKPVSTYFNLSFEPPFYYTLLHFWIKIFGTSEIAVRCLSLLGFSIAVFFVIKLATKLFRTSWLSWYLPLLFVANPMLLYYAFEARSYAWYMAFIVLSCYFYFEKNWRWYSVVTIFGLYTHAYIAFVPLIQGLHHIFIQNNVRKFRLKTFLSDGFVRSVMGMFILYIPWIYKMANDIPRLTHSWYYPVDIQLFKSVLGNIFLGFEGTPWFLWVFTFRVSIVLFLISLISIILSKDKKNSGFFLLLLYVPVSIILLISLKKPLFVMRYLMPSVIAEVFLIAYMLDAIKSQTVQRISAAVIMLSCILFTVWFTPYHAKPHIKSTMTQINSLKQKNDVVLVDDALTLFEAMYYNMTPGQIYWYNPEGESFPWYIGDFIIQPSQIIREFPVYPTRGFLIHSDGTFEITYAAPMKNFSKTPGPIKK